MSDTGKLTSIEEINGSMQSNDKNNKEAGEHLENTNSLYHDKNPTLPEEIVADQINHFPDEPEDYDEEDSFERDEESEYYDDEEDTHDMKLQMEQEAFARKIRRENYENFDLPKTVSLLKGSNGEMLYLVGTAHFSKDSCEDVRKVISMVQPDAVVVELCASRTQILTVDEAELASMSEDSKMNQLKKCVKQKGLLSGFVLYMMLHMSSHITKQLGMAPGGEFRAAFSQVKEVPGCRLYLGDRPIEITMQRMLASLSLWQKMKFGFLILQEMKPISAEDVEKMKDQDIFEQVLKEMVEEFPHMTNVLVTERDMFITGFLQKVLKQPVLLPGGGFAPPVVVGVVGIGHCNGIKSRFGDEITEGQMREITTLPTPSRSKKVVKKALKGLFFLASLYIAYKFSGWIGIHPKLPHWAKM